MIDSSSIFYGENDTVGRFFCKHVTISSAERFVFAYYAIKWKKAASIRVSHLITCKYRSVSAQYRDVLTKNDYRNRFQREKFVKNRPLVIHIT